MHHIGKPQELRNVVCERPETNLWAADVAYDTIEPSLSPRQRRLMSFPRSWHTESTNKLSPWTTKDWRIRDRPKPRL